MRLRYRFANQVVGAFVILALALTVALIVLMGANQRWFRANYEYYSILPDARDVTVGMAVTFRGFTIGRVRDITLNEQNEVDLRFTIQEEYADQVRENSIIQVVSNPLGGGEIVFHQGRVETPRLPEGSRIPLYDSKEGLRLRDDNAVIVLRSADPIAQIIGQVDPILVNLDRVLLNVAELTGDLEQALDGELDAVVEDLASISDNLRTTTEALRDPTGLIPTLLDPQGSVASLLDDDNELYDQITSVVSSLERSVSSLQSSLQEVSRFTEFVNNAQPQISTLLEQGRDTLDTSEDVLEGLRNNPLLRGGIPDEVEQPSTFQGIRDEEF